MAYILLYVEYLRRARCYAIVKAVWTIFKDFRPILSNELHAGNICSKRVSRMGSNVDVVNNLYLSVRHTANIGTAVVNPKLQYIERICCLPSGFGSYIYDTQDAVKYSRTIRLEQLHH